MIEIREPTKKDVKEIILNNEIYKRISYGKSLSKAKFIKKYFEVFYKTFNWLGIYSDNKIIGLANYEKDGRFHFQILKKYRFYASIALKKALSNIKRDLYCEIPHIYKNVILFAMRHNFNIESFSSKENYKIFRLRYEFNKKCNR